MARRHDTVKAKRPCVLSEQEVKLQPHSPFMYTAEYRKISYCVVHHYVSILSGAGASKMCYLVDGYFGVVQRSDDVKQSLGRHIKGSETPGARNAANIGQIN